MDEMDQLTEGIIIDMITESGNDLHQSDYRKVAVQSDFDRF
jgi:hypothetical protein